MRKAQRRDDDVREPGAAADVAGDVADEPEAPVQVAVARHLGGAERARGRGRPGAPRHTGEKVPGQASAGQAQEQEPGPGPERELGRRAPAVLLAGRGVPAAEGHQEPRPIGWDERGEECFFGCRVCRRSFFGFAGRGSGGFSVTQDFMARCVWILCFEIRWEILRLCDFRMRIVG